MGYKAGDEVFIRATVEKVTDDYVRIYAEGYGERSFSLANAPVEHKTYESGLEDAWELAKKIVLKAEKGGFNYDDFVRIFGIGYYTTLFEKMTVEEALAKIEAYEKEKEIKVNDIVKVKDERGLGIVTAVCPAGIVYVLWDDGGCGDYEPCELEKTGRTAEGLDLLLRQIKE